MSTGYELTEQELEDLYVTNSEHSEALVVSLEQLEETASNLKSFVSNSDTPKELVVSTHSFDELIQDIVTLHKHVVLSVEGYRKTSIKIVRTTRTIHCNNTTED